MTKDTLTKRYNSQATIVYIALGSMLVVLTALTYKQLPITQNIAWGLLGVSSTGIGLSTFLRKEPLERTLYQYIFLAVSLIGVMLCLLGENANRQAAILFAILAIISGLKLYKASR